MRDSWRYSPSRRGKFYKKRKKLLFLVFLLGGLFVFWGAVFVFPVKETKTELKENEPVFIWCSKRGDASRENGCFYADKNSFLLTESPLIQGSFAVLIEDQRNVELSVGKYAWQELAPFLLDLHMGLAKIENFANLFFVLTDDRAKGVSFDLSGVRVYVNKKSNPKKIALLTQKIFKDLTQEKREKLKYIDLTVEGKAYLGY